MSHAIFFNPPLETNFLGHQIKELYFDKVYDPYLRGKKDLTIVDVGGNIGMTSYYFSQFAKDVYVLEPSVEHFDILMQMVAHNKLDNVHPINKAIFMKSGKYPLFTPTDNEGNETNRTMRSLHQAIANPQHPKFEEVECITLPQLFADFSISHIDLLKLDVEGTEPEIICSTPFKDVAPKIDTIILEVHSWNGRHPNQLHEGLKDAGFTTIQPIQSDASILVATKQ